MACSPDHCLDPEQCSHEELKLPTKKIKFQICLVYGLTDLSAANNGAKKRRENGKLQYETGKAEANSKYVKGGVQYKWLLPSCLFLFSLSLRSFSRFPPPSLFFQSYPPDKADTDTPSK